MDRFVEAFHQRYPSAVIQWEDFSKDTAFAVLERYRKVLPSFNDDIQGTGAVTLAGVLSACRIKGQNLSDQRILVYGAGAGGIGVAQAILDGLLREGLGQEEALERLFVLDSKGLLLRNRSMEGYKQKFAKDPAHVQGWQVSGETPSLYETIVNAKGTVLLGLSGQPGSFTGPIVQAMQASAEYPVIFPLSNPTSSSEAIPEEILRWTNGKALVAAGSPFAPVEHGGETFPIGQGNNAFVFPGLGFGTVLSKAREVSDAMVLEASYALYDYTSKHHPDRVYPPTSELREVSQYVASRVIRQAIKEGLAQEERLVGLGMEAIQAYVAERFWQPRYLPFKPAKPGQ
jgi:malate dehydrogenase (oxaloacetate-decarboxylating)